MNHFPTFQDFPLECLKCCDFNACKGFIMISFNYLPFSIWTKSMFFYFHLYNISWNSLMRSRSCFSPLWCDNNKVSRLFYALTAVFVLGLGRLNSFCCLTSKQWRSYRRENISHEQSLWAPFPLTHSTSFSLTATLLWIATELITY